MNFEPDLNGFKILNFEPDEKRHEFEPDEKRLIYLCGRFSPQKQSNEPLILVTT